MRRLILVVAFAFVAWLILAPAAWAQEESSQEEAAESPQQETMEEQPLPTTGGLPVGLVLSSTALLLGTGVLSYAVVRRR